MKRVFGILRNGLGNQDPEKGLKKTNLSFLQHPSPIVYCRTSSSIRGRRPDRVRGLHSNVSVLLEP